MAELVDAELLDWEDIKADFADAGLLMGNGASISVSASFDYSSIFEVACSADVEHPLGNDDIAVFDLLGTRNFEEVLRTLQLSSVVCNQVHHDPQPISERYQSIRRALIEAARAVHPRHGHLSETRLQAIQDALCRYRDVFTTNYDLLTYWAIVRGRGPDNFRDFFWGLPDLFFDIADTSTPPDKTRVYYLHGALHLFRRPDGTTVKAQPGGSSAWDGYTPLLDYQGAEYPLFVSEGSSPAKLNAIRASDYLSFSYTRFADHDRPLTIFGHALGEEDDHLVRAIRSQIKTRELAREPLIVSYAIHASEPGEVIAKKVAVRQRLGLHPLYFDATTHPLGAAER